MKFCGVFIVSFILFAVTSVHSVGPPLGPILNSPRGYIYIEGTAVEECPEGTHAYMSNIMGPTWSQRTCAEPEVRDLGGICGMSRCDCDEPKVLDESTGNCVNLQDCPPSSAACPSQDCVKSA